MALVAGDRQRALELYSWNCQMAAACGRDLGHLEVAVRNAYHKELEHIFPGWLWSLAPHNNSRTPNNGIFANATYRVPRNKQQSLEWLNGGALKSLYQARSKAGVPRNNHTRSSRVPDGKIVASLTFGFWVFLTEPIRANILWNRALANAWAGKDRGWVHDHMENLNELRNRVAHMEPLLGNTRALAQNLERIEDVLQAILPADAVSWIAATSTVPSVFRDGMRLGVVQPSRTSYLSVPMSQMPALASRSSRPVLPSFSSRLSVIKSSTTPPLALNRCVNNDCF